MALPIGIFAQAPAGQGGGRGGGGQRGGPPAGAAAAPAAAGAKGAAPVDLTGYWVSIVTEDWIESVPFSETRGYIQSVLRYAVNYRRFYKE